MEAMFSPITGTPTASMPYPGRPTAGTLSLESMIRPYRCGSRSKKVRIVILSGAKDLSPDRDPSLRSELALERSEGMTKPDGLFFERNGLPTRGATTFRATLPKCSGTPGGQGSPGDFHPGRPCRVSYF